MKHWYISCTGTIFPSNKLLDFDEIYCKKCGDFHYYIGYYKTEQEAYSAYNEQLG